jgi:hypothetical protein
VNLGRTGSQENGEAHLTGPDFIVINQHEETLGGVSPRSLRRHLPFRTSKRTNLFFFIPILRHHVIFIPNTANGQKSVFSC